ncbi:MAG: DUF177 domain-containing protein [Anaerolineaceae bacterium]|nr:DUF177 domain-containing protein [Anaerolineaceae bacterium]
MNNKNNLLRINIGFLVAQSVGTNREFTFTLPELFFDDDEESKFTNVIGSTLISRAQQGLLIQGEFNAAKSSTCVRCLTDFQLTLNTCFSELYAFKEEFATDSELLVPDNGYIDLKPLLIEYLLVEIPIKPICKENCAGLCPICGCNLNVINCEHSGQFSQDEYSLKKLSH